MRVSELKIDTRRKKILDLLEQRGKVSVTQLSNEFNTSSVTIRSDLSFLEESGCWERVKGRAVLIPHVKNMDRAIVNQAEKRAIGLRVARVVQDSDTIFMNSGTTNLMIAQALKEHKNLNIVTSSLAVANELSDIPTFHVILLGRNLNVQYRFTSGVDVQEQLSKYAAKYAILSVDGVSLEHGITTYHADEVIISKMMAEKASRLIVGADHRIIDRVGFSHICSLNQLYTLVTDDKAPEGTLKELRLQGIRVIVS